MPEELILKVTPLLEVPEMSEERVGKASSALKNVRVWIVAMLVYYETLKIVNPMRETAKVMTDKLEVVMTALNIKLAEVAAINAKLDGLNQALAAGVAEANRLAQELDNCKKQLHRAEKMIIGL
jgi:dynein heavy chain